VVLAPIFAARLVRAGVPEGRIQVIAPPFRSDVVPGQTSPGGDVLFIGRLVRGKGAMKALSAVLSEPGLADRRLTVVGQGPESSRLRAAANDRGLGHRLRLLGHLGASGVRKALSEASVVVLPTTDDAVPIALIEALASGLPVVASPVGGIPWLVGEAGVLVQPRAGLIGAALVHALEIPKATLALARVRMNEEFGAEAAARKWAAVYASADHITGRDAQRYWSLSR
jgi:glycosyltransferase involved in cell wall biosynthesis